MATRKSQLRILNHEIGFSVTTKPKKHQFRTIARRMSREYFGETIQAKMVGTLFIGLKRR